jgi:hypothetical protein
MARVGEHDRRCAPAEKKEKAERWRHDWIAQLFVKAASIADQSAPRGITKINVLRLRPIQKLEGHEMDTQCEPRFSPRGTPSDTARGTAPRSANELGVEWRLSAGLRIIPASLTAELRVIPTIGLMIGAYIITRMIDLGNREATHGVTKVFAVLTLLFTIVCMFSLVMGSASSSTRLP